MYACEFSKKFLFFFSIWNISTIFPQQPSSVGGIGCSYFLVIDFYWQPKGPAAALYSSSPLHTKQNPDIFFKVRRYLSLEYCIQYSVNTVPVLVQFRTTIEYIIMICFHRVTLSPITWFCILLFFLALSLKKNNPYHIFPSVLYSSVDLPPSLLREAQSCFFSSLFLMYRVQLFSAQNKALSNLELSLFRLEL